MSKNYFLIHLDYQKLRTKRYVIYTISLITFVTIKNIQRNVGINTKTKTLVCVRERAMKVWETKLSQ